MHKSNAEMKSMPTPMSMVFHRANILTYPSLPIFHSAVIAQLLTPSIHMITY